MCSTGSWSASESYPVNLGLTEESQCTLEGANNFSEVLLLLHQALLGDLDVALASLQSLDATLVVMH